MDISIKTCNTNEICGFGSSQKKITRIQKDKIKKEEIKLGFVSRKNEALRKDDTNPSNEDNVWLYFPVPISKNELRKILIELDNESI